MSKISYEAIDVANSIYSTALQAFKNKDALSQAKNVSAAVIQVSIDEAYKRGAHDAQKRIADSIGSLAEGHYCDEPEFSVVLKIESIVRSLSLGATP